MKRTWVVATIAILIAVMMLVFILLGGIAQDPEGFQEGELSAPLISGVVHEEVLPGPLGALDYPLHLGTTISYTQPYQEFGGVLELIIENTGSNQIYVRWYALNWEGSDDVFQTNCSVIIGPDQTISLGMLHFPGPGVNGTVTFEVTMNVWTSSNNGNIWSDKGELPVADQEVEVLPEGTLHEREVQRNPVYYYNLVNELVDMEAVEDLKDQVQATVPGDYSVLQIIESYELVRSEFLYADDEDNHWQSAAETIELGEGDCEDHAILMASILTALGGDCRVNLISGHAFPTVYVGEDLSDMLAVQDDIRGYYNNDVPVFWIEDELGFWLVVDTVGMPYAGGYPAASLPVGLSGGTSWNFEDGDWLNTVDVTGEIVPGLIL